jgi:hypothetical protein
VAKVEPLPALPSPAPKAEPTTAAPPEPKADEKAAKAEATPAAPVTLTPAKAELSFNDWTAPLYAVYAYAALAVLVVIRSFAVKPKP